MDMNQWKKLLHENTLNEAVGSKKKLESDLGKIKKGKISNYETYGKKTMAYVKFKDVAERETAEDELSKMGWKVNKKYSKGEPNTEVQVAYFKAKGWNEGILKETGEWDADEGAEWLKYLQDNMKKLSRMTKGKAKLVNVRGFDMYQGPYATMKINGRPYKVWTVEEDDEFWIDGYPTDNTSKRGLRKGFQGDLYDLADAISQKTK